MTEKKALGKGTRSFIEVKTDDPIVITLLDDSVFKSVKYLVGAQFVTTYGHWVGEAEVPNTGSSNHLAMIPLTAIKSIDFEAREVTEAEAVAGGYRPSSPQQNEAG